MAGYVKRQIVLLWRTWTKANAPARRKNLVARRTERVRREVAAAAEDLFAKRGYDDTTVEDIADAAEISPGPSTACTRPKPTSSSIWREPGSATS